VNKKLIIITAAAGLVSFAGAFSFVWLTKPKVTSQEAESVPGQPAAGDIEALVIASSKMKPTMTEEQLKNLVFDIQEKIKEYNEKLESLEVRERRLQMAHDLITGDIEKLNNLRVELASAVARLRSEQDKLFKSRVEIAKAEKANLMSIAATYDRMKPDGASKILTNMSKIQTGGEGNNLDDAVKILHYMGERTRANLLAELTTSEPKLAAILCQRLKQIVEKE